jgi:hypothetical protein
MFFIHGFWTLPVSTTTRWKLKVPGGGGGATVTVTVALFVMVPPAPVHARVKVLLTVSAPVDCVPLMPLGPFHASEAVQPVVFVDDQLSVALLPLAIEVGLAPSVSVGAGAIVTVTLCVLVPPAPVQARVNVLSAVSAPVGCVPLAPLGPFHAPEAVQPVVFEDDQLSVALPPLATEAGLAPSVSVGCGGGGGAVAGVTVTVTPLTMLPPSPVQSRLKMLSALSAPVDCVPLVFLGPLQVPEALQPVALADDQLNVALAPLATEAGLTSRVSVGAGLGAADFGIDGSTSERLQAASHAQATTVMASERLTRRRSERSMRILCLRSAKV